MCTASGTTSELNLADYFHANKLTFKPVVFDSQNEARAAFFNGRCQALSADVSYLSSVRASDAPKPDDFVILPELISKEPLGPLVARDDLEWFSIVKWTLYVLIEAEEKGVTAANLDAMKASADPSIQRFLGVNGELGMKLGLDPDLRLSDNQEGRQLWRDVRAQSRPEDTAPARAQSQRSVDPRRADVRHAGKVNGAMRATSTQT